MKPSASSAAPSMGHGVWGARAAPRNERAGLTLEAAAAATAVPAIHCVRERCPFASKALACLCALCASA